MLKRYVLALCFLGGFAASVCASSHTAATHHKAKTPVPAVVRRAIEGFVPGLKVDTINPSPLPGFYQVIADGRLVYVSNDGRYLFYGGLVDLVHHKNLSNQAWAKLRKSSLAKIPVTQRIVFAPPHPKYHVTIFTDITCGFCRALHQHIADFNKEGIAVEYLAWPRSGIIGSDGKDTQTYRQMVSVWCSAHRRKALTAALNGHAPKAAHCDNPVKAQFDLGRKLGLRGTPAIVAADGTLIGGYLTPKQMLQEVRQHSSN